MKLSLGLMCDFIANLISSGWKWNVMVQLEWQNIKITFMAERTTGTLSRCVAFSRHEWFMCELRRLIRERASERARAPSKSADARFNFISIYVISSHFNRTWCFSCLPRSARCVCITHIAYIIWINEYQFDHEPNFNFQFGVSSKKCVCGKHRNG